MESIIQQVQAWAESANESSRQTVIKVLRDLQHQLEPPQEAIPRVWNEVCASRFFMTKVVRSDSREELFSLAGQ
jgi:hypothetical protein